MLLSLMNKGGYLAVLCCPMNDTLCEKVVGSTGVGLAKGSHLMAVGSIGHISIMEV